MESKNATDPFGLLDGRTASENNLKPQGEKLEELEHNCKEFIRTATEYRLPYERDWELYNAYVKGDQFIVRNRNTNEVIKLSKNDSKKLRSINNQCRPIARSLVGKLTAQLPTCTVLPASSDVEEQHGARVGSALLQYWRRKDRLDTKYLQINEYLPAFGNAFLQVVWDPKAGRKIAYCEVCHFYEADEKLIDSPCPQCSQQRQDETAVQASEQETANMEGMSQVLSQLPPDVVPSEDMVPQDVEQVPIKPLGPLQPDQEPGVLTEANEGDVRFIVRDPRDCFVPAGIVDIAKAVVYATREVMTVAEARATFPEKATEIDKDDSLFTDRSGTYISGLNDFHIERRHLNDHCWVWELYEGPTEEYTKGRIIHMVNDRIVEIKENPYHCADRVNLFHFGFDRNPGEFYCEPFMAQAWHRQKELNRYETQDREYVEKVLKPPLLVPNGSQIAVDDLTMTQASILKFNNAGGFPQYINPPPMPQGLENRKQEMIADIRTQAAITDAETGTAGSDPNGRAMAIVSAEADRQVGPIIIHNNEEWREAHRFALILAQKYYAPDRLITTVGTDGLQTFSFAELNLSPGWDIQIEEQDGMSRNPAIRFNEALQLAQVGGGALFMTNGPMGPAFDAKKFSRLAKLKMTNEGYDTEATERATASGIPYLTEQGQVWQPRTFDDPAIFAEELLGWLRGPGRHKDPQISMQVEAIWQYYVQWGAQGMMPPPPGAPQPPGIASGPGAMSAPGGSPNNPGGMPTGGGGSVSQNADAAVSNADQMGESLARQGASHEA